MNAYLIPCLRANYLLAAIVLALSLSGCSRPSDEQALIAAAGAIESAVEEERASGVLEWLAPDFRGNDGLDRRAVRQMLYFYWRQHEHINVQVLEREIHIEGGKARMQVVALALGRDVLPERGRLLAIDAHWRKLDGEWRVQRATWRDAVR